MAQNADLQQDLVHLARLGIDGRPDDVRAYVKRVSRRVRRSHPEFATDLADLLGDSSRPLAVLRRSSESSTPLERVPEHDLVREERPSLDDLFLVLDELPMGQLQQVIAEHDQRAALLSAGLAPTQMLLFHGPPGVGKTHAARWLAAMLDLPLLILDLSAVMSSMLGRTGANLREVMDLARSRGCVLLLDEFDAIAKRRGDDHDVGELKRLVTVLLQQLDAWPVDAGIVVAATNHPELLDAAVWRRFAAILDFRLPSLEGRGSFLIEAAGTEIAATTLQALAAGTAGMSYSDIELLLNQARRKAIIGNSEVSIETLLLLSARLKDLPSNERRNVAVALVKTGAVSQRQAHELTGVSRDTIRRYATSAGKKGQQRG